MSKLIHFRIDEPATASAACLGLGPRGFTGRPRTRSRLYPAVLQPSAAPPCLQFRGCAFGDQVSARQPARGTSFAGAGRGGTPEALSSLSVPVPTYFILDASRKTLAPWARPVALSFKEGAWPAMPTNATFWMARVGVDRRVGATVLWPPRPWVPSHRARRRPMGSARWGRRGRGELGVCG